jgi:uncharacterized damage-inducible protein DinB
MKEKLIASLEKSKNYTVQVAEAMPENNYGYKPADSVWNFGELVHHLAYCSLWMEQNLMKGKELEWNPPATLTTKKEILRYLSDSFDTVKKALEQSKEAENTAALIAILEHIAHHRGQATTYLRISNITPPEYPF